MKKISALIIAGAMGTGLAAQAQLIDAFNGESLSAYTATSILENSDGAGSGVTFSDASGLLASFSGATSDPEQALLLTPTALPVGDALVIDASVPVSSTTEDLGIAISATATPTAAGSGNGYNSRGTFDFATVSVRPSQTAVRANTSISGTVTTANGTLINVTPTSVAELFIESIGSDMFTLGYVDTGNVIHNSETVTFGGSSTIGAAIGIYGDIRTTGTSLGTLSDLSIIPNADVPEPTSLALCGLGLAGAWVAARRKSQ